MRWLGRALLAVLVLVVAAVAAVGYLWWRARQEPEFLRGAVSVTPAEADQIVAALGTAPAAGPAGQRPRHDGPSVRRPTVPYVVSLGEREIAAVVVSRAPPAFAQAVSGVRVRIRERDLVAAGTVREEPLAGQTAWIEVRPAARGGRLCLGLGRLHLGSQAVPERLVRELSGGRAMPRVQCLEDGGMLPGPLGSARIEDGRVVLRGVRR